MNPHQDSETLRKLHLLWEEIQTHLDMSQRRLDEEQRLSQNLFRQYQDSQRRIKILKIYLGNAEQFADKIRAKEDSIRSVLYESYQSIVNSGAKDSQLTSEEVAKSSESSATNSLEMKERQTFLMKDESTSVISGTNSLELKERETFLMKDESTSVISAKTAAGTIDVDEDHYTEMPLSKTTGMPNDSVAAKANDNLNSHSQTSPRNNVTIDVDADQNLNPLSQRQSSPPPNNVGTGKEMESYQMDIGCRFYPTDQELIACVAKKVAGEATPKFIEERDLYGSEEPQELFKANPSAIELYFFTSIKKKFDTGTRSQRLVGNGTWKIQGTKDIYDDPHTKNKVIGYKKTLNFMHFKSKNKEDSWIMHEYTLTSEGRWAICRIKRGRDNNFGLVPSSSSSSLPAAPVPPSSVVPLPPVSAVAVPPVSEVPLPPVSAVSVPPASLKRPLEKDNVELERPNKKLQTASEKDNVELERPNKKLQTASDGLLQLALASESLVSAEKPTTAATIASSDQGHDLDQKTPPSSRAFPKSCINFL